MMYRFYTGKDGLSHVEKIEVKNFAVIVYTHIQKDSAVPASREEIEAQFVDELSPLQSNTD